MNASVITFEDHLLDVLHGFKEHATIAIAMNGYYDLRIEANDAYVRLIPNKPLETEPCRKD
jgi:hypothetical protein